MDLPGLLRVFQRSWTLLLATTALGLIAASTALLVVTPTYESSSRLFVSTRSTGTAADLLQGSTYTQDRVASYAQVATDPIVLDPVISDLGLSLTAEELAEDITAEAQTDSLLIVITAKWPTGDGAARLVNAVATQLSDVVTQTLESPIIGTEALVSVNVTKEGTAPESPASPILWLYLVVGGAGGLLIGVGLAFLINALDTRVRSIDDLKRLTPLPLLGAVTHDRTIGSTAVVTDGAELHPFDEAFGALRSNLQFIEVEAARRVLLVTSSVPGEGKSTVATNLALSLVRADKRVLLVEADLRKPQASRYLGLEDSVGLSDVLVGNVDFEDVAQKVGESGRFYLMSAGSIPPNPSELLGSSAFVTFIETVAERVDHVIIDSPPVLPVTDATVLSQIADGVVVVVGLGGVRRAQVELTLTTLATVGAPIVGVVANHVPRRGTDGYSRYAAAPYIDPSSKRPELAAASSRHSSEHPAAHAAAHAADSPPEPDDTAETGETASSVTSSETKA